MYLIFLKDIRVFLFSLIGYLSLGIFFTLTFLFLWFIPSEAGGMNILDNGYATLEPYFQFTPWVFLFLVPSITMRSYSDEMRTGTMELLLTKPLTLNAIIWGKFFAGWFLVLLSIMPFFLYYFTVYQLGFPKGNLDAGGTWGALIGLIFLGGVFISIGNFCSSLTDNQVVAFVLAATLCFLIYVGFDMLSESGWLGSFGYFIQKLGLAEHYRGLSKGVLDSRDLFYFLSMIWAFNILTLWSVKSKYQSI
ncbi:MAG: ABC transporter permease subunit [Bacteroidia bacterium]|nr:ABC transporter permease subunit [Bacteroidia bacterium]